MQPAYLTNLLEANPEYQYDIFMKGDQIIANINILFVGDLNLFRDFKSSAPKNWQIHQTTTVDKEDVKWLDCNIIFDATIRDQIDLSRKVFSNIEIVCCASTGSNHIKIPDKQFKSISVFTLKDTPETLSKLTSAAEFSFGLLITLAKKIMPAAKSVSNGSWNRTEFAGQILLGKTLGIIGYGRIGKHMANFAQVFGMQVRYFDPFVDDQTTKIIRYYSIEKLVTDSDFISLHVPYEPRSVIEPIITKEIFSKFKFGSYFINTSRGELIDESGLISAIQSGTIRGAALDVVTNEPNIQENLLFEFSKKTPDKILITPHIAGNSLENVRIATLGMLNFLKDKLGYGTIEE